MQNHPFLVLIETVHGADRHTGCIGTVHAGHRDRPLSGLAILDGHDPAGLVADVGGQAQHHYVDREHDGDQGEDEQKHQKAGLAAGPVLVCEEIHLLG